MDGRHAGFTLIELCITLVLAALLSGIAAPAFAGMVLRLRADAVLSAMTVDFANARMRAIAQGKEVVVCPSAAAVDCDHSTDWLRGWISFEDGNRNRHRDHGENVVYVHQKGRSGGLSVQSTAGRKSIVYRPDGFSLGANLTVTYCVSARVHARLVVNNGGRTRVERPARPTPCPA